MNVLVPIHADTLNMQSSEHAFQLGLVLPSGPPLVMAIEFCATICPMDRAFTFHGHSFKVLVVLGRA